MARHEVVHEQRLGRDCTVLVSHEHDLRAGFAPSVGMVGYSLTHRGGELLGQRGGLAAYRERGSSFGIPLLHPWANRLSARSYSLQGRRAELDPELAPVHFDPNGLPIHGVLAASPHWSELGHKAGDDRAVVAARLDYGAHEELLAAFPFPHELEVAAELAGATLSVNTTLSATGDVSVPVSFGWHPYLALPGVELPVRTRALLDERGIPTGRTEPVDIPGAALGERAYDDLFTELGERPVFALEGGGRRVELEFGEGYELAQVYAPAGESPLTATGGRPGHQDASRVPAEHYICFEPMTAPTDALVSGTGLRFVSPGASFSARFRIRVSAPSG